MPQTELAQWLRKEIEKNPLLEIEASSIKGLREDVPSQPSLYEHLIEQIREQFSHPEEVEIAKEILEELDEKGFITKDLQELSHQVNQPIEMVKSVLSNMQAFHPSGIFARNLQETLLIQLKNKNQENTLAYKIIQNHFEDLTKGKLKKIKEKEEEGDFKTALKKIGSLNFRPASLFHQEIIPLVKADLSIAKAGNQWMIETVEDEWPELKFHEDYLSLSTQSKEEKNFIDQCFSSAHSILYSLKRRQQLLIQVGAFLVRKQKIFLDQKGPLKPLSIRDLAKHLNVHESTVSRALSGKYAMTPRGFMPLHDFFCTSPIAQTAKQKLQQLIEQEDKTKPMTDEELVTCLQKEGVKIARRTVVKYRHQLKINAASRRKYI
jgi:RNA polymerase sigma-54 factor